MTGTSQPEYGIVYFDGVCNLCNGFVDFLIRRDKARRLRYASLQSSRGATMASAVGGDESIVFDDGGAVYVQSNAVLRVVSRLGGAYRLVMVFVIIPRPLRDLVYRWVARHRYGWFGKRDRCRVPTPEEREFFVGDEGSVMMTPGMNARTGADSRSTPAGH